MHHEVFGSVVTRQSVVTNVFTSWSNTFGYYGRYDMMRCLHVCGRGPEGAPAS